MVLGKFDCWHWTKVSEFIYDDDDDDDACTRTSSERVPTCTYSEG